ncbi:MAG: SOS response-associated peptidase [Pelagibacteraceae bacterium]|jgi:putative SOS response-associated peptidase YedK|nr:SOS response-associated peptidase [Pelagibacteraceae bacterium]
MCGRYVITKPVTKTKDLVKTNIKVEDKDNYNAHPTQKLPIIKSYTNGRALENCDWGLVPSWAKDKKDFRPLINARLETLMEKVSFKKLIQTSRCLVIADGYYEWKRENKEKTPYYFTKTDSSLMFLAGIHQNNQFCIITREANETVKNIHHREPLIINQEQILNYLNIKNEGMDTLRSIKPPELKFHVVRKDVNKPINNDPSLINSGA